MFTPLLFFLVCMAVRHSANHFLNNLFKSFRLMAKILCAPLQGYTDSAWRTAQKAVFGGVDTYYSPFLRVFHGSVRGLADVLPERNAGISLVPQVLAGRPDETLRVVEELKGCGYKRIDLNMGCPFPPVTKHRRGAGLLLHTADAEALCRALAEVQGVEFSVKMRLGFNDPAQWRGVMPFVTMLRPVHIAMHARVAVQQYDGCANLDEFGRFLAEAPCPVVYNGDVATAVGVSEIEERFPAVAGVMIGRALVADPALLCRDLATAANYSRFHNMIFDTLSSRNSGGDHVLLGKMKSLWAMFLPEAPRRARKTIKKSTTLDKYLAAVSQLFAELD